MIKDLQGVHQKIVTEIRESMDIGIVGLSGGADSTLVATLLVEALGKENVWGIHMPYNQLDLDTFNSRSKRLVQALRINELTIPIGDIADSIDTAVAWAMGPEETNDPSEVLSQVNQGNSRSRSRMCVLYSVAHNLGGILKNQRVRVVGTGNLSEDFIGYDTKGGDALADLFPIGQLLKSEVYQMLEYFRHYDISLYEEIINTPPSAGLWDGQTDEEELGYTYAEMELPVIQAITLDQWPEKQESEREQEVADFTWDMHFKNKHKHEAPPTIQLRHLSDDKERIKQWNTF